MGEAATAVSDEVFSTLAENLGYILETRALLCVIAPEDVQGEAVVEAALSRCDGADPVMVTTASPGTLAALLDAFHAALHLGVRPRRLAEAQRAVEDELARRSLPVVVVRDAHLLRTEALQYVYGLWSLFQDRERRMPVVLVGPEKIRSVLRWPSLASLESCIFIWHRLTPSP
ncbi:AAA family ATPase [Streptomyces geranii]|uniref:AAA family ATPase n=1 Tax=Streptomyces geranii TaxID=2058923 RepID=UPI000D039063|nr:AAA family ATPase [Streptomyces geranii]